MNTGDHTMRRVRRRRILRVVVPLLLVATSLLTTYGSLLFAWLTAVPPDSALERRQNTFYGFCGATIVCWLLAIASVYWLRPRPLTSATCIACGYDLAGLGAGGKAKCPECGKGGKQEPPLRGSTA